jgi:D-alanyl-D-alanine carboxypeptidase/D-alanyl-D-alanine-endopeptidase (penicillin-binding protein 4)
MRGPRLLLLVGAILLLTHCLVPVEAQKANDKLRTEIEAIINGPDYKHAHWGLLVTDLETGRTLYEHNADKLFTPASTTKLYSAASALDALGAEHRFETPVVRKGDIDKAGHLQGDMILVASGDLTMGGRTTADGKIAFRDIDHTYANGNDKAELTEPDPLAGLNELAKQVAAAGVQRIRGEVLVDDRLFEKAESTGSGPTQLSAILINDNVIDFRIVPDEEGKPARVEIRPSCESYQFDVRIDTAAKETPLRLELSTPGPGRLVLRGQIAAGHKPLVRIHEVEDAANHARTLFIEALRRTGVIVDASPFVPNRTDKLPERDAVAKLPRVATLTSLPFSENAKLILKVSHNLHASTLPLLVAVKNKQRTLEAGLRLQNSFLKRAGVEVDTISFGGGAGGSRADCTTPRATVQLLRHMATRPDFAVYEAALPILGVDGTLADVAPENSPARGKVRAKTGTFYWKNVMNDRFLLNSKALAGYVQSSQGRKLAFAFFVNNTHFQKATDTSREGKVLGKLAEIVYVHE